MENVGVPVLFVHVPISLSLSSSNLSAACDDE